MVNLLKFKYKSCKKYSEDLWGFVLNKGKYDNLGKELCNDYSGRRSLLRRSKSFKELLDDQKKIRLFYGGVKMVAYKRYSQNNLLISNLECRLAMIVYRLNFVSSIGEGLNFVKLGYFVVNNEVIKDVNYIVKVGDMVSIDPFYKEKLYNDLKFRIENRYQPLCYPKYLEVNYQIMSGILLYKPSFDDIYLPFKINKISLGKHYI